MVTANNAEIGFMKLKKKKIGNEDRLQIYLWKIKPQKQGTPLKPI